MGESWAGGSLPSHLWTLKWKLKPTKTFNWLLHSTSMRPAHIWPYLKLPTTFSSSLQIKTLTKFLTSLFAKAQLTSIQMQKIAFLALKTVPPASQHKFVSPVTTINLSMVIFAPNATPSSMDAWRVKAANNALPVIQTRTGTKRPIMESAPVKTTFMIKMASVLSVMYFWTVSTAQVKTIALFVKMKEILTLNPLEASANAKHHFG